MRKKIISMVGAAALTVGAVAAIEAGLKENHTAAPSAAVAPAMPVPPPGGVTPPKPPAPPKKSTVGGLIGRPEVISRARYWYDHRNSFSYNQSGAFRDPQGRLYRTDCSGFVSMALHLNTSLSTVTLPDIGKQIPRTSMHAGDFTGHLGQGTAGAGGHVRIFEKWINQSAGTYMGYDFGSTPVKYRAFSLSTTDYWVTNGKKIPFTAVRYSKIR